MSFTKYIKRGIRYILKGEAKIDIRANISYLHPNRRLEGKKIIVTGGGRGLGAAMSTKFVAEGAKVLICGRNEKTLQEHAEHLGCYYLPLNIADETHFHDFILKADEMLGGCDCLVNNAGISLHEGNIRNVTPQNFDDQFDANLRGGYFLAQQFIRLFEDNKRNNGNILFISSERGSYVDDLPYGLTKAAINSLVQGLARRLIHSGIRVNALAPGVTASEMTGFSSKDNLHCDFNLTNRVYLPEEVAEVACFLLSDASNCLSGQIFVCNEGKSINSHWN